MSYSFRARLLNGERLIGTMVTLGSPEVAELLAEVGFDWLFIDAEHSVLGARDIQALLQAAGRQTPGIVRLGGYDEAMIKKVLDAGAAGIIVPQVNSVAQAEWAVRAARYAPLGARGVGIGRAQRYGFKMTEYIAGANEATAVIVQAEHIEAVRNIESIARVPGIDAVFVGPYDLSASMGHMGQIDHPEVVAAVEQVSQACSAAGVRLGIFGVSAAAVRPYIERGYTLIVSGVDTLLLGQAATGMLAALRA